MNGSINRRDFLKRVTSTGFLIATSSLPALAEDNPSVFPKRGKFERLSVSYATIDIGLKKPFSIMHISDTHLTAAYSDENDNKQTLNKIRTETFGGRQEEALRDSLEWARLHTDYVVHTGDLIDWQSRANFDLVKKYFGTNLFGTLGNHEFSPDMWLSEPHEESTETFKELSRETLAKVFPFDINFYSQIINGVNFVCLDDVYGTVTKQQVEQFRDEVQRGLPIILCMHVPFYTDGIWRATRRFWGTREEQTLIRDLRPTHTYKKQKEDIETNAFISYLKEMPLLRGILAGHEHITVQDTFSETAVEYVVGGNFLFHAREIMLI